MKKNFLASTLTLIGLILLANMVQAAPPRYIYHDLGTLGGNASNGESLNHAGRVVGDAQDGTNWRAFFKDPNQPMQDMLAAWTAILSGTAYDINPDGHVVGYFSKADGRNRAFWKSPGTTGSYKDLGDLGGDNSYAYAINSSKQVVGAAENGDGHSRAFIVTDPQYSAMQDLETLGGDESIAYDINDSGRMVGTAQDLNGNWLAFLKPDLDRTMAALIEGNESCAYAINNLNQIVGYIYNDDGDPQPFLKNPSQTVRILGMPTGAYGEALDINDTGQVVGEVNDGGWFAAFWENKSSYNLNDLTVNLPPNVRLYKAAAINDRGWIVGSALVDSLYNHAFLLTPAGGYVPMGLLLD